MCVFVYLHVCVFVWSCEKGGGGGEWCKQQRFLFVKSLFKTESDKNLAPATHTMWQKGVDNVYISSWPNALQSVLVSAGTDGLKSVLKTFL